MATPVWLTYVALAAGQDTYARQLQGTDVTGLDQWPQQPWRRMVCCRQLVIVFRQGVRCAANDCCDMAARC